MVNREYPKWEKLDELPWNNEVTKEGHVKDLWKDNCIKKLEKATNNKIKITKLDFNKVRNIDDIIKDAVNDPNPEIAAFFAKKYKSPEILSLLERCHQEDYQKWKSTFYNNS